jgi:hypothetical protein
MIQCNLAIRILDIRIHPPAPQGLNFAVCHTSLWGYLALSLVFGDNFGILIVRLYCIPSDLRGSCIFLASDASSYDKQDPILMAG